MSSRKGSIDPSRLVPMDKLGAPSGGSVRLEIHILCWLLLTGVQGNFNVVFVGAGNIMFGSPEGPWNHSFRFEHKLGPRLKVIALIDPAIERAHAALKKKCESFVVSAYQDTRGPSASSIPVPLLCLRDDMQCSRTWTTTWPRWRTRHRATSHRRS
jgi:hypothetical protein